MASTDGLIIDLNLDLENEIPATAIVDVKESEVILTNTVNVELKNDAIVEDSKAQHSKKNKQIQLNDVKQICRICLFSNVNLVSMMSKSGSIVVADMYYSVTSIEVLKEENIPLTICSSCQNNLTNCYRFKVKCVESNNILKFKLRDKKDRRKEDSGSVGKIDKETQTYNEDTIKIHQDDTKPVQNNYKIELNVKTEVESDHEDIEYLEEDMFLINEIKETTNVIEKSNTRYKDNIVFEDSNVLLKEIIKDKKYTKKRQLSCSTCSKKFKKSTSLKSHVKQCRANKPKSEFSCGQCKESFSSENDLQIHSALHSKGSKWKCNQCEKEFTDRTRFRRHIRRHMESKRWACETCGKTFPEMCALRRHVRVHTGEKLEKKYKCNVCDKKFCDNNQLAEHSAKHTGLRPCSCDVCGKTFASARLLASHSLVHSDQKAYPCAFCDKRFRQKSTRNIHHRTHTGEKPYICSICGKSFIQNSNLRLHMRTHTGERPYTCDVCGRKFTSGSSLTSHKRIHTGEKPYSCPVCGKRFARTDFRPHMRIHTGERPFACCVCPKKFVNAARLRDHYLIHTGEQPFQCALCSEKFKKKVYLVKHLKIHAKKDKKTKNKDIVIYRQVPCMVNDNVIFTKEDANAVILDNTVESNVNDESNKNITLVTEEMPLEVSGELILQDDSDVKSELVVVDDGLNNYQTGEIDLKNVNYVSNNDLNINDVSVMAVNDGEINLSASAVVEGTTVKLYQLDESLLQIQTAGQQVTIRKITSKMTANF